MPTPLQRQMFIQGQLCFFCNRTIPKGEASLEHLVGKSHGGTDQPENLVVCCRTLNTILGNMNVKDKLRVILRQSGKFVCPMQVNASEGNPVHPPPPHKPPMFPAPPPKATPTPPRPPQQGQVTDLISPRPNGPRPG